jgi:hypothetical protein
VLFIGIHGYRGWQLFDERRPVQFAPEEQRLYELAFSTLQPGFLLGTGTGVEDRTSFVDLQAEDRLRLFVWKQVHPGR